MTLQKVQIMNAVSYYTIPANIFGNITLMPESYIVKSDGKWKSFCLPRVNWSSSGKWKFINFLGNLSVSFYK